MANETLIAGLNEDLANELTAVCQYVQYAAEVQGQARPELRTLFQAEITDELLHVQYLADRIAAMGGKPRLVPNPVPPAETAVEMLQALLRAEEKVIAGYTTRIGQAEAAGEIGLKVRIEDLIADETMHRDEMRQILARWE